MSSRDRYDYLNNSKDTLPGPGEYIQKYVLNDD